MIREQEQLWQQRITEWQASGLSGMAYCKQQSLTYCRFVYWRKKLASLTAPEGAAPFGFARVAPVSRLEATDGLTLSLPGGASITGLQAGNIELLGAILRQL
ncbi:IS66 family insertion sequence element accessory protein TnpB [Marinobacter sp. SS8-8]|uniref:IS66 family insertion sequence element accessory protein TnpA n=1 Tax=Marinobacter sp. SS8-8 TaxID=3050452 RepID=UPI0026DFDBA5|nr:IS66 family insertion sequence element accessory protein TnpB [Marinobacter sp. SS8-8]